MEADGNKVIGLKQSIKAVKSGDAMRAFVARDADGNLLAPFLELCREKSVKIDYYETRAELGRACGIDVGAAVAVITHKPV